MRLAGSAAHAELLPAAKRYGLHWRGRDARSSMRLRRGNVGLRRVWVHKLCTIRAGDGRFEGSEASRRNLGKKKISVTITKHFLQGEPVLIDDVVGPRLRLE